jgi:hypothetical protein
MPGMVVHICHPSTALRRLRPKFKASLGYIVRPCYKKMKEREEGRKEGRKEGTKEGRKEGRKEEKVYVMCILAHLK